MKMLNDLFKPDYKSTLSVQVSGRPGSGKTYFLRETIKQFLKLSTDPDWRLVYVDPKHEINFGTEKQFHPISVDKLERHLRRYRVAVVYPDPDFIEAEVDYAIDTVFNIEQANPDFNCTFVVDDAQVFLSSRKAASPSFRRLSLTGRSKGIRFVSVSHSIIFSKDLEGSCSFLLCFNLPFKAYWADSIKRYGFDPEPFVEHLAAVPYSFVWFDVTKASAKLMKPIEI